jgi:hypothetical protein
MKLRESRQDGKLVERRVFRDAIQRSLGEKIHRDEHSRQERDKRQC